jgi:hypothetical protein
MELACGLKVLHSVGRAESATTAQQIVLPASSGNERRFLSSIVKEPLFEWCERAIAE